MDKFESAIQFILDHEGGYCNDPADPGGETNFGICKRVYPQLDIRHLTEDDAIKIYRRDYWKPWMEQMPINVAAKMFDMCVNMGTKQAVKLLQRAVGCQDDGIIGPITMSSIRVRPEGEVLDNLVAEQRKFYTSLATQKPEMKKFLKGWLARANWTPDLA